MNAEVLPFIVLFAANVLVIGVAHNDMNHYIKSGDWDAYHAAKRIRTIAIIALLVVVALSGVLID